MSFAGDSVQPESPGDGRASGCAPGGKGWGGPERGLRALEPAAYKFLAKQTP